MDCTLNVRRILTTLRRLAVALLLTACAEGCSGHRPAPNISCGSGTYLNDKTCLSDVSTPDAAPTDLFSSSIPDGGVTCGAGTHLEGTSCVVNVVGDDVLLLPASSFTVFRGGLLCLAGATVLHADGSTEPIAATTAMAGDVSVAIPAQSSNCLGAGVIGMKAGQMATATRRSCSGSAVRRWSRYGRDHVLGTSTSDRTGPTGAVSRSRRPATISLCTRPMKRPAGEVPPSSPKRSPPWNLGWNGTCYRPARATAAASCTGHSMATGWPPKGVATEQGRMPSTCVPARSTSRSLPPRNRRRP